MSVHTTRRRVLATAAWAAPAVAVVSAAPAFAASTANGTLTISRGASRYGLGDNEYGQIGWATVLFNGFTVTPSKSAAGPLVMTVTSTGGQLGSQPYGSDPGLPESAPSGWSRTSVPDASPLTYVSTSALTTGTAISFGPTGSNGTYFDDSGTWGDFEVVLSASGFDSVATVFRRPV
ncbi:hypothetical protein [Nocardioides zeae]